MDLLQQLNRALVDRYEVEGDLGAGGMATVYLARDLRHDRKVALKVLRPELAAVLGPERFLSEIKVTANLQHPHLLPLFDSGEAEGLLFYVMPYVEGETLRDRLERERQLPVDEAVRIGAAVASALDYAHRHNVIHRDLKPENILLHEGQPLVTDFGIALAVSVAGGARITQTGLSLGTPQYMSPEQATGDRQIDARSDIHSLGTVVYEMLVGDPPHTASTVQAVIAKVLTDRPHGIRSQRPSVPEHVEAAVMHALEKLPADRFTTAGEFAEALTGARPITLTASATAAYGTGRDTFAPSGPTSIQPAAVAYQRKLRWAAAWAASVALAVVLTGLLMSRRGAPGAGTVRSVARFAHVLPEGVDFGTTGPLTARPLLAVSPDGSSIVYVANQQLYLRALDELEASPIPGTTGFASTPFFSPDGQWVGYWSAATNQLKKISIRGGAPVVTCAATSPFGASWGEDDTIVFAQSEGILRVSANGGTPELVIATQPGEQAHGPQLLPDRDHILFTLATGAEANRWDEAQIVVQSLASGERRTLLGGRDARYVPTGHLLYAIGDALLAVRFDPRTLEVVGGPVSMTDAVRRATALGVNSASANYGFSQNGVLAYIVGEGAVPSERSLVWVDRSGRAEPLPQLPSRAYVGPRLSPNGQRVLFWTQDGGDIWIYEIVRGAAIRLTRDGVSNRPVWSPDGARVAYTSGRAGVENIFVQASDGSGEVRQITSGEYPTHADSWSPDGQMLLVHQHVRGGKSDILAVPVGNGADAPRPLLQGDFLQDAPVFSPDGRWIAYHSTESGQREVYITPYPGPGGKFPVSTGGGREPVWGRNGELFYRNLSGDRMMAVRIVTTPTLQIGEPRIVFEGRYETGSVAGPRANYAVTPDGRRFLMVVSGPVGAGAPAVRPQINIVLNWFEELNARAPRP